MELGHLNKHFARNTKKTLQVKILVFFFLDTLKTTFWMEYLTQKMVTIRVFFPKSGHFSRFSKKGRGGLPYTPSSV